MTSTLLRRLVTQVVVVFVALAAILTSGAPAQSLGDVARKEEARRKATANGKVYTNDDLRGAPAPRREPGAAGAATRPRQPLHADAAEAGREERGQAGRPAVTPRRAPVRIRRPAHPAGEERRGSVARAAQVDSGRARSRGGVRRCAPEPDQWPHHRFRRAGRSGTAGQGRRPIGRRRSPSSTA